MKRDGACTYGAVERAEEAIWERQEPASMGSLEARAAQQGPGLSESVSKLLESKSWGMVVDVCNCSQLSTPSLQRG